MSFTTTSLFPVLRNKEPNDPSPGVRVADKPKDGNGEPQPATPTPPPPPASLPPRVTVTPAQGIWAVPSTRLPPGRAPSAPPQVQPAATPRLPPSISLHPASGIGSGVNPGLPPGGTGQVNEFPRENRSMSFSQDFQQAMLLDLQTFARGSTFLDAPRTKDLADTLIKMLGNTLAYYIFAITSDPVIYKNYLHTWRVSPDKIASWFPKGKPSPFFNSFSGDATQALSTLELVHLNFDYFAALLAVVSNRTPEETAAWLARSVTDHLIYLPTFAPPESAQAKDAKIWNRNRRSLTALCERLRDRPKSMHPWVSPKDITGQNLLPEPPQVGPIPENLLSHKSPGERYLDRTVAKGSDKRAMSWETFLTACETQGSTLDSYLQFLARMQRAFANTTSGRGYVIEGANGQPILSLGALSQEQVAQLDQLFKKYTQSYLHPQAQNGSEPTPPSWGELEKMVSRLSTLSQSLPILIFTFTQNPPEDDGESEDIANFYAALLDLGTEISGHFGRTATARLDPTTAAQATGGSAKTYALDAPIERLLTAVQPESLAEGKMAFLATQFFVGQPLSSLDALLTQMTSKTGVLAHFTMDGFFKAIRYPADVPSLQRSLAQMTLLVYLSNKSPSSLEIRDSRYANGEWLDALFAKDSGVSAELQARLEEALFAEIKPSQQTPRVLSEEEVSLFSTLFYLAPPLMYWANAIFIKDNIIPPDTAQVTRAIDTAQVWARDSGEIGSYWAQVREKKIYRDFPAHVQDEPLIKQYCIRAIPAVIVISEPEAPRLTVSKHPYRDALWERIPTEFFTTARRDIGGQNPSADLTIPLPQSEVQPPTRPVAFSFKGLTGEAYLGPSLAQSSLDSSDVLPQEDIDRYKAEILARCAKFALALDPKRLQITQAESGAPFDWSQLVKGGILSDPLGQRLKNALFGNVLDHIPYDEDLAFAIIFILRRAAALDKGNSGDKDASSRSNALTALTSFFHTALGYIDPSLFNSLEAVKTSDEHGFPLTPAEKLFWKSLIMQPAEDEDNSKQGLKSDQSPATTVSKQFQEGSTPLPAEGQMSATVWRRIPAEFFTTQINDVARNDGALIQIPSPLTPAPATAVDISFSCLVGSNYLGGKLQEKNHTRGELCARLAKLALALSNDRIQVTKRSDPEASFEWSELTDANGLTKGKGDALRDALFGRDMNPNDIGAPIAFAITFVLRQAHALDEAKRASGAASSVEEALKNFFKHCIKGITPQLLTDLTPANDSPTSLRLSDDEIEFWRGLAKESTGLRLQSPLPGSSPFSGPSYLETVRRQLSLPA